MIAHQRAMTWQELFDIACQERLSDEELLRLAQQVASGLQGRGRFTEAARVYLDYGGNDVCSAVVALCEGGEFAEALRIVSLCLLLIPNGIIYRVHSWWAMRLISDCLHAHLCASLPNALPSLNAGEPE